MGQHLLQMVGLLLIMLRLLTRGQQVRLWQQLRFRVEVLTSLKMVVQQLRTVTLLLTTYTSTEM